MTKINEPEFEHTPEEMQVIKDAIKKSILLAEKDGALAEKEHLELVINNLVQLDDYIRIDEKICTEKCGGLCCINIDVRINPFDIWSIVNNNNLGLNKTYELFNNGYLQYYIGSISKLPVAAINFIEKNKNLRVCPFLAPILLLKSKQDEHLFHLGQYNKILLKNKDNKPTCVCAIQQSKPTICRSSPLGRAGVRLKDDIEKSVFFFTKPYGNCKINQTQKKVRVRDYIEKMGLIEYYRNSTKSLQLILQMKKYSESVRYFIGMFLYNFDQLIEKNRDAPIFLLFPGLLPDTRPKTFEEILNITQNIMEKFDLMKKGVDSF